MTNIYAAVSGLKAKSTTEIVPVVPVNSPTTVMNQCEAACKKAGNKFTVSEDGSYIEIISTDPNKKWEWYRLFPMTNEWTVSSKVGSNVWTMCNKVGSQFQVACIEQLLEEYVNQPKPEWNQNEDQ